MFIYVEYFLMGNSYAHQKEWGKCNVKTSGNLMSDFFLRQLRVLEKWSRV